MAAAPVLWLLCSASALATVRSPRVDPRVAEFGEPVISRGGAADSESAAIAMASLCRKAGLQGLTRWVDEHGLSMTHMSLVAEKLLLLQVVTRCRGIAGANLGVKVVLLGFGAVKSGKRGLLHTNFSPFDYD